ncbi:MAG: metallophosphoesterase [Candidatus Sumerlaeia bacterium]|nr:metallophosphoesterase [Candidatus Sumerlaeia bacterium]
MRGACVIAALALAGGTARAAPLAAQVRFAVIGDYGTGSQAERDVAALVRGWNPEFIATTGDNNYYHGARETIDVNVGQHYQEFIGDYRGAFGPGSVINRFFPIPGNHDWDSGEAFGLQPYLDYFTLPGNERYYDIRWGPVHLFMLDSDPREPDGHDPGSAQSEWLKRRLRASGDPWNLVFIHHAPHSSGGIHGSQMTSRWPFTPWGAQATFAGHDHHYERLFADGIPHFVNAAGGAPLYTGNPPIAESRVLFDGDWGAQLVTADLDSVRIEFFTRGGALVDRYHLTPWTLDGLAEPNLDPVATGGLRLYADRVGDWLYVACDGSGEGDDDRFVFVSRSSAAAGQVAMPLGKEGTVPGWDFFLFEDGASDRATWHLANGAVVPLNAGSDANTGPLLEGAFNMVEAWGHVPESVHLCAASFGGEEGGALNPALQVPSPGTADGDIEPQELLGYGLPQAALDRQCPWVIDGILEAGLTPRAQNGEQRLYAEQRGEWLCVAALARDTAVTTHDVFIYVARAPGAVRQTNWLKAGGVAAWDFFLAREGAGTGSQNWWSDAEEDIYLRVSRFPHAAVNGGIIEGAFNMVQAWGAIPPSVSLAVGEYGTDIGGALDPRHQVPAAVFRNGTIGPEEFLTLPLSTVVPSGLVIGEE